MTTPLLLQSPPIATATRDDIDLPLLERDFTFLPTLHYAEVQENTIDFDAFTQQSRLSVDVEAALFRQMHLALFQAEAVRTTITSASAIACSTCSTSR